MTNVITRLSPSGKVAKNVAYVTREMTRPEQTDIITKAGFSASSNWPKSGLIKKLAYLGSKDSTLVLSGIPTVKDINIEDSPTIETKNISGAKNSNIEDVFRESSILFLIKLSLTEKL